MPSFLFLGYLILTLLLNYQRMNPLHFLADAAKFRSPLIENDHNVSSPIESSIAESLNLILPDFIFPEQELPEQISKAIDIPLKIFKCQICSEEFTSKNSRDYHTRKNCQESLFLKHLGDDDGKYFVL